jgi:hypothetical protein
VPWLGRPGRGLADWVFAAVTSDFVRVFTSGTLERKSRGKPRRTGRVSTSVGLTGDDSGTSDSGTRRLPA